MMTDDLQALFARLAASPRLEGFQGVHFNRDLSVLVVDRWRSKYFACLADLELWLTHGIEPQGGA